MLAGAWGRACLAIRTLLRNWMSLRGAEQSMGLTICDGQVWTTGHYAGACRLTVLDTTLGTCDDCRQRDDQPITSCTSICKREPIRCQYEAYV